MYKLGYKNYVVKKEIPKLNKTVNQEIQKAIMGKLIVDPMNNSMPLKGKFKGRYRFRVGSYRVLFEFDGRTIMICRIYHRSGAYK